MRRKGSTGRTAVFHSDRNDGRKILSNGRRLQLPHCTTSEMNHFTTALDQYLDQALAVLREISQCVTDPAFIE